jgi:hypothetical protein
MGETIFNAAPGTPEFEEASGWVGAVNGIYNLSRSSRPSP